MKPGICNYFIAILPPGSLQSDMMAVKQKISTKYQSKGALRSPAHITLHMPFEWKESRESLLIDTLSDFRFAQPLTISLNNYGCFEPRVIFIAVQKNKVLDQFQEKLVFFIKSRLNIFNQYEDKRGFHPHITVAFRDLKKPLFYEAWNEMKEQQFPGEFESLSFHLLKMEEKKWESRHEFNFIRS